MAYSLVQEAHAFSYPVSGNPSVTPASPITKGNLLIAMVQTTTNSPVIVDDGRNIWHPILGPGSTPLAGGRGFIQVFYGIAESTRSITLNGFGLSSNAYLSNTPVTLANAGMQFLEFSGGSMNPFVTSATATGTSTAPAAAVTSTTTNNLVIGFAIGTAGDTVIETAGWTNAAGAGVSTSGIYAVEATAATWTPTFLQSASAAWGCIALAFQPPQATFTISGSLTALAPGATVNFISQTHGALHTATATAAGIYTSPALENDTYIVQPILVGVAFTPKAQTGVVVNGANATQNFGAGMMNTNLVLVQTAADSMVRANENPLSDGGNWIINAVGVPPWDNPFQLVSSEAVLQSTTIVSNAAGPWAADAVSIWYTTPFAPCSMFMQVQVDACSGVALEHAVWTMAVRSSIQNVDAYVYGGVNNNDGTMTLFLFAGLAGGVVPSQPAAVLTQCAPALYPYLFWKKTITWAAGDNFGIAVIGDDCYMLHNGVLVGTISSVVGSTMPAGIPCLTITCNAQADVQLSHFATGHAYLTGAPVTHVLDNGTGSSSVSSMTSTPFNLNVGELVVVFTRFNQTAAQTVSGVTDTAGNSYTQAGHTVNTAGAYVSCWYTFATSGNSANVVTVTYSAAVTIADFVLYHVPKATTFDNLTSAVANVAAGTFTPSITTTGTYGIVFLYIDVDTQTQNSIVNFPVGWTSNGGTPVGTPQSASGQFANSAYRLYRGAQTISPSIPLNAAVTGATLMAAFNLSPSGTMANAFVQGTALTAVQTVSPATISYPGSVTAGDLLIATWRLGATGETVGVSDTQGNTWTLANQTDDPPSSGGWAYAVAKNTGSNTVNISYSPVVNILVCIAEYSGANTARAIAAGATGSSANPTSNAITTTSGDLLIAPVALNSGTATVTPGSGYNLRESSTSAGTTFSYLQDSLSSPGGSTMQISTVTGGVWYAGLGAFYFVPPVPGPPGGGDLGPGYDLKFRL
jgi:hypothetical protein